METLKSDLRVVQTIIMRLREQLLITDSDDVRAALKEYYKKEDEFKSLIHKPRGC